jgi:CBS domain-containing protein
MARRTVRDLMTTRVVTVTETTPFKELAAVMAAQRVSAVPVLSPGGQVTGLVSEADLLPKEEFQQDPYARPISWWQRHTERRRAGGVVAREVMSAPVITISPAASVVAAARLMDRSHVKRLPVTTADGRLAGIVSRADLVRVFLRPDEEIRAEVLGELSGEYLQINPALLDVSVTEGVVTLAGEVEDKTMIPFAVRITHSVDGVVDVVDKLTYAVDDTVPQRPPAQVHYQKPERPWPAEYPRALAGAGVYSVCGC